MKLTGKKINRLGAPDGSYEENSFDLIRRIQLVLVPNAGVTTPVRIEDAYKTARNNHFNAQRPVEWNEKNK